jgi:hypothetical protein
MPLQLPLKKLVVEVRYKPNLRFFGQMDAVGLELTDEFPDWERSPLTVEVRNKKKHRRLYLASKRAFCDIDGANPSTDFTQLEKLLTKVCTKLDVKTFGRIGMRQWFAADIEKAFALMVDEFVARFLVRNDELNAVFTDKTTDVAYVVDCVTNDGWKYNLRMGPMVKSQWFSTVAHESSMFEQSDDDGGETFAKFQAGFPQHFLYIDIDCFHEEQDRHKLGEFLTSARRRSQDLVSKLIAYCKK